MQRAAFGFSGHGVARWAWGRGLRRAARRSDAGPVRKDHRRICRFRLRLGGCLGFCAGFRFSLSALLRLLLRLGVTKTCHLNSLLNTNKHTARDCLGLRSTPHLTGTAFMNHSTALRRRKGKTMPQRRGSRKCDNSVAAVTGLLLLLISFQVFMKYGIEKCRPDSFCAQP